MRSFVKDLLLSIPAVLMLIGIVTVRILSSDVEARAAQYQALARAAFRAKNYSWALLCYVKAEQPGKDQPYLIMEKAECLEETDSPEAAEAVIEDLKLQSPEFIPAKLFLIRKMLGRTTATPAQWDQAQKELAEILEKEPRNLVAHSLALTVQSRKTKDPKQWMKASIIHFEQIAQLTKSPSHWLRLANAYSTLGETEKFQRALQITRERVDSLLKRAPKDVATRILGAQACLMQRDFQGAINLMQDGLNVIGPDPKLMQTISTIYLAWAENESQRTTGEIEDNGKRLKFVGDKDGITITVAEKDVSLKPTVYQAKDLETLKLNPEAYLLYQKFSARKHDRVLQLLVQSTRFQPVDPRVYGQLAALVTRRAEDREVTKQALMEALAKGQSPALIHTLLGVLAERDERASAAQLHWQLAEELDPKASVAMNNVAWGLTWQSEPPWNVALALINAALKNHPDAPQLRDTRGQILLKMGNAEASLPDLEFASANAPKNWQLHEIIADAYRQVKQPVNEAKHRAEAKKLKAEAQAEAKAAAEQAEAAAAVPANAPKAAAGDPADPANPDKKAADPAKAGK